MPAANTDLLKKYKSLFSTTLSTSIGTGTSDTITPATVTGLPTTTALTLTFDRVDSGGVATPTKLERITGVISGGNFTSYVRAKDGTTEQAHTAGAVIEMVWNAQDWNDLVDWGLVEHSILGVHTNALVTTLKAAGSDVTTGTNDTKIVTPLAATGIDTRTATFTNKRITKRTVSTTQAAAPAINTDVTDVSHITGLAQAITSMTTNLTGTPVEGDTLRIDITDDGTARAITWGASFESSATTLPTTTVLSQRLDILFHWNTVTSKWRCVNVTSSSSSLSSKVITFTRDLAAVTGNVGYTGVGFVPTSIIFLYGIPTTDFPVGWGYSDSSKATGTIYKDTATSHQILTNYPIAAVISAGNNQTTTIASYDADGFTIAWVKTGSPTGTLTVTALCFR